MRKITNQAKAVREYIVAYRDMPESPEEVEAADEASTAVLAEEPWD